jgi:hypothetical protein
MRGRRTVGQRGRAGGSGGIGAALRALAVTRPSDDDESDVCRLAELHLSLAWPGACAAVTAAPGRPADLRGVLDVRLEWPRGLALVVRAVVHDELARGAFHDASRAIGLAVRAALDALPEPWRSKGPAKGNVR